MQHNPQNNSYNPNQKPSESGSSSYWGKPPQTPVSKHDPRYQSYLQQSNGAPIPPPLSSDTYPGSVPNNPPVTPPASGPINVPTSKPVGTPASEPINKPSTPTSAPISMPTGTSTSEPTDTLPQTPPPPQKPKRGKGAIISIVIVLFVVAMFGIGGCVACSTIDDLQKEPIREGLSTFKELPPLNHEEPNTNNEPNEQLQNEGWANSDFRSYFLSETNNDAITTSELEAIKNHYYSNQSIEHGNEYSDGVWFVGKDLPAGSYWLEGDEDELSYFFVLNPNGVAESGQNQTYNVVHINNYYGYNIMDFKEGDVVVLDNDEDMIPLADFSHKFKTPYESGVYRVGIDIPAGSYELKPGDAPDYYAYYIMKNLDYENSSYLEDEVFMNLDDNQITVTVKEGEYLELYNMKAYSLSTSA